MTNRKQETFLAYGKHWVDESDIEAVSDQIRNRSLTQGQKVAEFEQAIASAVGAKHVVAVNSATSGLHIAALAGGVGPGLELVTSPITFVASANCGAYCGARPVFCDIDSKTYNLSPASLEKVLNPRTKMVVAVHFAGQSAAMKEIRAVVDAAQKKFGTKIYLVEDASHALGSTYLGKRIGECTYSDMTIFSFHPVKHITSGEGGAIATNDTELMKKLLRLRSHGITADPEIMEHDDIGPWYYEQIDLGYNYRITELQCVLGISQLKKLPQFTKRRREIVDKYNRAFAGKRNMILPFESPESRANFHLYVVQFNFKELATTRAEFMNQLKSIQIGTQVHYIPVHTQPYYRRTYGYNWGDYPMAEAFYENCLSIPLYPALQDSETDYVIENILKITGNH